MKNKSVVCLIASFAAAVSLVCCGCARTTAETAEPAAEFIAEQAIPFSVPELTEVDIGGTVIMSDTTELVLEPGQFEPDELCNAADALQDVKKISLPGIDLTCAELALLEAAFPEADIIYTVHIADTLYDRDTVAIDLSQLQERELISASGKLGLFPNLEYVDITGGNELSPFSFETFKTVSLSCTAAVGYRFEFYGQPISAADESLVLKKLNLGEAGAAELSELLQYMHRLSYMLVDECGISSDTMAAIRDRYPEIKVVWRIFLGALSFFTDVKVIHLANEIGDKYIYDYNSENLKYCTDIEYLDLGHNILTNIDFCAYMPHLKYIIMSYNFISDLTPLQNCPELEMAEFYFCIYLSDISPLKACKNLRLLNISATAVEDITPVYEMAGLERFYCIMNFLDPDSQTADIYEYLPDCWITFEQNVSINVGWSYDEPRVRADWYLHIYDVWRYNVEPWYMGDI